MRDLVLRVEAAELAGVETDRSRFGTASRASEGDMLGEGDEGRCTGELSVLAGGVVAVPAMLARVQAASGQFRGVSYVLCPGSLL